MTNAECQEVFALLSEYLDEELPVDLCERMDSHIRNCSPCVEFVDSLRKSIELTRTLPAQPAPPALDAESRARLLAVYRTCLSRKS